MPADLCPDTDTSGTWQDEMWAPAGCGLAWFTPAEAQQCLAGRRVLFVGDSMIRQLYLRLVRYLRGLPEGLEWG